MSERGFLPFWILLLLFLQFFLEFSYSGQVWTEFGNKIFFLSFSAYLILFWLKIMPESGNLFLSIFFGIFFPGPSMNGIRDKIFYRSFSTNLIPFSLKILPERGFLIYWFFFYFSRNFLTRVENERNSGQNFFSLFFHLSHPVLAKNNAGKTFF